MQAETLISKANELLDAAEKLLSENPETEVVVLLDRSRSMERIKEEVESGFGEFLSTQEPETLITLAQFDTEFELVFSRREAGKVSRISLSPRGMTALNDSLARLIFSSLQEIPSDRRCVFVVITDGQENASKEVSRDHLARLIEKCQEQRGWKFVYLGANQDAILNGQNLNIYSFNSITYDPLKIKRAMATVGSKVSCYRSSGDSVNLAWTEQEREDLG